MMHICTDRTDLDELIGNQHWEGQNLLFHYGPLAQAMKRGEELILEHSDALSPFMLAKVKFLLGDLFIDDTAELIHPHDGFRLTLRRSAALGGDRECLLTDSSASNATPSDSRREEAALPKALVLP